MWIYFVVLLWVCNYIDSATSLSCGPAPSLRNADYTSSGTSFNDTVVYTCRPGYTMNGDNVRRCTAKGKWSGVGPNCLRVCNQPDLPFGAYVKTNVKTEYKTGETVILDCKKGFKKIGQTRRICISGRWTAFPFECKVFSTEGLSCGPVPSLRNADFTSSGTSFNDTVVYTCQPGYTMNGDNVRRCTAKGKWSGFGPSCLPDCGLPIIPQHAYIENNKSKYASGDRVTFKCVAGYNQEGIATTLCFMGKWNVMPFRCDKEGCGDPGTPENGNKVGISYAPGREVFFSCNIGYVRNGSEQRRCLTNNTWSGTQPTCELINCGPPEVLRNGTIIGSETTFRKSISFRCDKGFELDGGDASAICQSDGKWNNQPKCILRRKCVDPGTPSNGIKKGRSYSLGDLVFFACNFGYKIVGSLSRICLANSKWSGAQPTCKRLLKDCAKPEVPYNAYIANNRSIYLHGETVTFRCKKRFLAVGINTTYCFMGKWNAVPFSCVNTRL